MTERHLADLENALTQDHWCVIDRLEGDDYRVSGFWIVARPDGSNRITLAFDGLDDMRVLPMEKAYGCTAQGVADGELCFARGASWKAELRDFMNVLKEHADSMAGRT
ncbi:hypothetical protein AB838_00855 [Rhodobacteraceae bacterium (ex Bugula neritina AB1)]|nr:hypothetical protein AB838_00855 [Rhodobacteraceae bacterium (ex Bugula neritina AB1)]